MKRTSAGIALFLSLILSCTPETLPAISGNSNGTADTDTTAVPAQDNPTPTDPTPDEPTPPVDPTPDEPTPPVDPVPDDNVTPLDRNGSYANCYVINTAGTYSFAAVRGIKNTPLTKAVSADVLWENIHPLVKTKVGDVLTSVAFRNSRVIVSTPKELQNGNAVVVVRDASGEILWSWHIWVVKGFSPKATAQYYPVGTYVMDRHLGEIALGADDYPPLYQWGRKDPFLSNTDNSSIPWPENHTYCEDTWPEALPYSAETGTIEYSVAHPMTFLLGDSYNHDWTLSKEVRWSDNAKTDYDPCPYGWKVPSGGPDGFWGKATKAQGAGGEYEWDYKNGGADLKKVFGLSVRTWYQYTGVANEASRRQASTFVIKLWSTTKYDRFYFYLNVSYSKTELSTDVTDYGCRGLAVRCVQE